MQGKDNSQLATVSDTQANPQNQTAFSDDDLAKLVEQRRREAGITFKAPEPIGGSLHKILKPTPLTKESLSDEQLAAIDAARRQREIESRWSEFSDRRGCRYAACRLANFAVNDQKQEAAVNSLRDYCEHVAENIQNGKGVVLFGPRGTGKDHLAMAVARAAVISGAWITWRNGMDLYGDIRDAMGEDGERESDIIAKLVKPDLLYMSDPIPIAGPLSAHQMNMLFRVLDGRYSRRKAMICTVNVANGTELDDRMGPQNADRLKDGALAIYCNWTSYRKAQQ